MDLLLRSFICFIFISCEGPQSPAAQRPSAGDAPLGLRGARDGAAPSSHAPDAPALPYSRSPPGALRCRAGACSTPGRAHGGRDGCAHGSRESPTAPFAPAPTPVPVAAAAPTSVRAPTQTLTSARSPTTEPASTPTPPSSAPTPKPTLPPTALVAPPTPSAGCRVPASTPRARYVARGCAACGAGAAVAEREELRVVCADGRRPRGPSTARCRDGAWEPALPRCETECGKLGDEITPLIVQGQQARYGRWPWQAALYVLQEGNYTFWCGGSLISERFVLTAAHCVWKQKTENLRVALGKHYSSYERVQDTTQIRDVKEVMIQPSYQDQIGNYGSDIALLFLSLPVELTAAVRPVCIDWNAEYMDEHLSDNNTGVVLGWGVNENDTHSDSLRMATLMVRSPERCIAEHVRDFRKYVTFTTFCAGHSNGTGVCNGDSGGGLMFHLPHDNDTWVIQGLVSVSPRRRGTSLCDSTKYTIFTKVGIYVKWLKAVLSSAGEEL